MPLTRCGLYSKMADPNSIKRKEIDVTKSKHTNKRVCVCVCTSNQIGLKRQHNAIHNTTSNTFNERSQSLFVVPVQKTVQYNLRLVFNGIIHQIPKHYRQCRRVVCLFVVCINSKCSLSPSLVPICPRAKPILLLLTKPSHMLRGLHF